VASKPKQTIFSGSTKEILEENLTPLDPL
jgi:hypothetical protein